MASHTRWLTGKRRLAVLCTFGGAVVVTSFAFSDIGGNQITMRRLTPENVQKALAVDLIVADREGGSLPGVGLNAATEAIERTPELSRVLASNGISAREYLLAIGSIMYADVTTDLLEAGPVAEPPVGVAKANIEFWRSLPPDVRPLAERWKDHQRHRRLTSALRGAMLHP